MHSEGIMLVRCGKVVNGQVYMGSSDLHDRYNFQAYQQMLPITVAKKKDLLSLIDSGVVPREHRAFYGTLPTADDIRDELAESDINDPEHDHD